MTNQELLNEQKLSLIECIIKNNDLSFLNKIEDFIVENLPPPPLPVLTHEELAERLEKSKKAFREGRYITVEELEEKMKSW